MKGRNDDNIIAAQTQSVLFMHGIYILIWLLYNYFIYLFIKLMILNVFVCIIIERLVTYYLYAAESIRLQASIIAAGGLYSIAAQAQSHTQLHYVFTIVWNIILFKLGEFDSIAAIVFNYNISNWVCIMLYFIVFVLFVLF